MGAKARQLDLTHLASDHARRSSSGGGDRGTPVRVSPVVVALSVAAAGLLAGVLVVASLIDAVDAPAALTVAVLLPAAVVDVRERRLPDVWVAAATGVFLIATIVSWSPGRSLAVDEIGLGAVLLAGPILALHVASPPSMGFGDVKAAAVLGLAVGSVDWRLAMIALTLAAGSAAVTGVVARVRTIAFGPFLVVGASFAVLGSDRWLASLVKGG